MYLFHGRGSTGDAHRLPAAPGPVEWRDTVRIRKRLWLPKEHGAWAMFAVPLGLGALSADDGGWRVLWLALAALSFFIAREPLLAWWRGRLRGRPPEGALGAAAVYLALAALSGAPLLAVHRLWGMIPIGLAAAGLLVWNARQVARREERTLATETIGVAGLTLAGPAAHYAAAGRWTPEAWSVWAVSAAYFIGSIFYVRLRVLTARGKRPEEQKRVRRWCAVYHAALAAALAGCAASSAGGIWFLAAYVPALWRAGWHVTRPARQLILVRVGLQEVAYSLWFLALAAAGFAAEAAAGPP